MPPYPQWTEREFVKVGARDDLGIEALGESILSDLLPGINNQTKRARYYSFWAWALHRFIEDKAADHSSQQGFYNWARSREDALILAYFVDGCEGGIAGTEQAYGIWGNGEPASFPLDWKSLLSVDGGAYELYYRGSLSEMNIISIPPKSDHDDLTNEVGRKLAEAYEEAVSPSIYVRSLIDANRLRKTDIEDFAKYGCVCKLNKFEKERKALIDAFFRFSSKDAFAVKRLASLCFFLDVINQSRGEPLDDESFRQVLYFWSYGDHHRYTPSGNFIGPAERWRIFQFRQYYVFAFEAFWSLFLNKTFGQEITPTGYIQTLAEGLNLKDVAEKYSLNFPDFTADKLKLGDFIDAVHQHLPEKFFFDGTAALSGRLNEQALTKQIRAERTRKNIQIMAGDGLLLLALLYLRQPNLNNTSGWNYLTRPFAADRLPIEKFLHVVEKGLRENWSILDWIRTIHERDLWLQHRLVTLKKLTGVNGKETAKFELLYDDRSHFESLDEPALFVLDTDYPKMNGPRFPSALSIASDLQLVESLPNNVYRLTSDGEKILMDFSTYTIPE